MKYLLPVIAIAFAGALLAWLLSLGAGGPSLAGKEATGVASRTLPPAALPSAGLHTDALPDPQDARRALAHETVASDAPASEEKSEPINGSELGVVRGRVLAADGSAAISAVVHLAQAPRGIPVDARGAFEARDVPLGTRLIRAESHGLNAEVRVDVASEPPADEVLLRLSPGGWIEGRMLSADGAPAPDRPVKVSPDVEDRREVRTDSNGTFRIGPLAPEKYEVYGFLQGEHRSDDIERLMAGLVSSEVRVRLGQTTEVELQPSAGPLPRLSGSVLRDGEALPNALLLVVREARSFLAGPRSGSTDTNGRFDIELSGPGRQLVLVIPRGAFDPTLRRFVDVPTEGLTDVTFDHPSATVVLELEEGGPSLARAELDPLDAAVSIAQLNGSRRMLSSAELTPRFSHLEAGRYRLTAYSETRVSGPFDVTLAEGQEVRVPIRFEEGGTLLVEIVEAAPTSTDISLLVVKEDGRPLGRPSENHDLADGPWTSPSLSPGPWCVIGATADGRAGRTAWTTVAAGAQLNAELSLQAGARLVCVARRAGEPVPASFRVFDAEGRECSTLFAPSNGIELVTTRSDEGHFGPLPPGRYRVVARRLNGTSAEQSVTLAAGKNPRLVIEFE